MSQCSISLSITAWVYTVQCSISLSALITGIHLTFIWRPPSSWLLMDLMINLAIYNYDGNTGPLADNDTPFVVFMISPFSNSVQTLFMTHTEALTYAWIK